uniref:Uncharacterized protein n=1 Tax=Geospiza parvula TaxID=87175 RepID=A0A8U8ARE1_GEOPR
MLITLCYLYLWARWGPRSAALVRSTVRRLHRSRCSFTFCARQPHPDERVCLRVGGKVFCTGEAQIVKWSDFCSPLAYKPGEPLQLIAEASVDNFSSLGIAFLEDRLHMENGMVPHRIVSVHLEESALKELAKERKEEEKSTGMDAVTPAGKSGLAQAEEGKSKLEEEREKEETGGGEHHHLHLSSCHECLQLESSTIESVKFASAENIAELPQDCGGTGREKELQSLQKGIKRMNLAGKPPNVLIYLGSEAAEGRLEQVKAVLRECLSAESYTLYPLRQEQVLREPWVENSLLLLIATEEPIPEGVHRQFMRFLSKGGKILGLSSSFTFGGVQIKHKNKLRRVVHELVVSKKDSTEVKLSLLLSGCVFEEGMKGDGSTVKVLSRLSNAAEDSVIVHLTHGSHGGEAILSQAHLELDSNSMDVQTEEDFNLLKMSNSKRYEVLREILTCLGLSCESSAIPELTPIYLLSPDEEIHLAFLKWLEGNVDAEGLRASSKVSLKFVSSCESKVEVTPSLVPVITEMGSFSSEHFSLQTYQQHLHTKKLGKILLFTEVTTTTMNLLDGLMFELPEEMGLIAVAVRQTQGKGRGGNAWLSPMGCALSTLHLSIPLHSNLGQRIPFIQHLVSLAVVEAVRSIPGYEDIELRVKWPNDIYYSDLMKIGGVLVNSTLIETTFHILIGFGFNVSNSNPTICINDLIAKFNREEGTELKPLSADCLIARTVTVLERLIEVFQEKGPNGVLPQYYKYWVHRCQSTYLGQAKVHRCCFRNVHYFAIGCHDENKAIQSLKWREMHRVRSKKSV